MIIKKMTMKLITIFLLSLSSFLAGAQDLSLYQKKEYTNKQGRVLPYRILYPDHYDRTKKYPLILFLHGAGERGNDNEKQLTHGAKLFLKEDARANFPAIVVFPQCPAEGFWGSVKVDRTKTPYTFGFDYSESEPVPLASSIALIKQIMKEEGVDRARVYITGLSMGGMGTFEAVYRYPKLFAAAMPICGGGDVTNYNGKMRRTQFWVFHGDQDAVVDVKNSREMVDRLEAVGVRVKYTEYSGVNHNSWDNAFAEPKFLSWMFSSQR
jgi:predicted peptidase